jgi:hypothetical protein
MASQQLAYLLVMADPVDFLLMTNLVDFLLKAKLGELPLAIESMLVILLMVEVVELYVQLMTKLVELQLMVDF